MFYLYKIITSCILIRNIIGTYLFAKHFTKFTANNISGAICQRQTLLDDFIVNEILQFNRFLIIVWCSYYWFLINFIFTILHIVILCVKFFFWRYSNGHFAVKEWLDSNRHQSFHIKQVHHFTFSCQLWMTHIILK